MVRWLSFGPIQLLIAVLGPYVCAQSIPPIITGESAELHRRMDKSDYLRILPLGASITQGYKSSTGNGYRKPLRDQLRWQGWPVNMVGTLRNGTMVDNYNEGHVGWLISQVQGAAENIISLNIKPNLVLLNVGTNDCLQNNDPAGAPDRLKSLIQTCLDGMPNVAIVASTLLPNGNTDAESCIQTVNQGYKNVVNSLNNPKVILADFHDGFITTSDLQGDGTHPTDAGYTKMASVWWAAFPQIVDQISPPEDTGIPDDRESAYGDGSDDPGCCSDPHLPDPTPPKH